MQKKKGISLIVLVITIIVMIILAATIIISLRNNGIIGMANESTFKQSLREYQTSLNLYLANNYLDDGTSMSSVYLDENTEPTINEALDMTDYYARKLIVDSGELTYVGDIEDEIKWCEEIGVPIGLKTAYEVVYKTGDWKYITNNDGTITLTEYTGSDSELVIPTKYRPSSSSNYMTVYGVSGTVGGPDLVLYNIFGESSNSNKASSSAQSITSIIITDGIKYIGPGTFMYANLSSITIPESVKVLGFGCFCNSEITTLNFNAIKCNSQSKFGYFWSAFDSCPISAVNIGNKVTKIPLILLGNSNTYTFDTLNIPASVEAIENYAFYGLSNLKTINISNNLKVVGKYAFYNSGLNTINYSGNFEEFRNVEVSSNNNPFRNATVVYSDTIPEQTKTVSDITWKYNIENGKVVNLYTSDSSLTGTLTIPSQIDGKDVISIGKDYKTGVIANSTSKANVTSIVIPEGIEIINDFAFYSNTALTGTLALPSTLKRIGYGAFYKNNFNGALVIPNSVEIVDGYAFSGTSSNTSKYTSLTLGSGLKEIGAWSFQYCSSIANTLTFPDGLEKIGDGAFNHCNKITNTSLTIPSSVKQIGGNFGVLENTGYGSHVFYDFAKNCTTYTVASGNNYFKSVDGILYNKSGTRLISIPNGKTFTNNRFEVPEGVIQMDEMSFAQNASVQTLVLPNSYKIRENMPPLNVLNQSIELGIAIYMYSGVKNIEVKSSNPNYISVDGCLYTKDGKSLVYVPKKYSGVLNVASGTENIGKGAVYSTTNNAITSITIPASLKEINSVTLTTINSLGVTITVDANNAVYKVDTTGKKIVAK